MMFQLSIRRAPALPSAHSIRRGLALVCIGLGIAGCILPLIPGLPFFVLGGRLLGPRDRSLRAARLGGRRLLRRARRARQPWLRSAGQRLAPHWESLMGMVVGG